MGSCERLIGADSKMAIAARMWPMGGFHFLHCAGTLLRTPLRSACWSYRSRSGSSSRWAGGCTWLLGEIAACPGCALASTRNSALPSILRPSHKIELCLNETLPHRSPSHRPLQAAFERKSGEDMRQMRIADVRLLMQI